MLRRVFCIALMAGLVAVTQTAQAGWLSQRLKSGQVNVLEDFDREVLLKRNAGGDLEPGIIIEENDLLVGVFQIEALVSPIGSTEPPGKISLPDGGNTLTGVFISKILTKTGGNVSEGGAGWRYTLGAASDDDWSDLGLTRGDDGTIVSLYVNSNGIENFPAGGLPNVIASLASGVGESLSFEFGFTGVDGAAAGFEYWQARSDEDNTLTAGSANNVVTYNAGLNVTVDNEALIELDPLNVLLADGPTQAQLNGFIENPLLGNPGGDPLSLPVNTDTDFFILPTVVPEPASLAIWGFAGLVGLAGARRRRKA